jgi:hypothetical protein
MCSLLIGGQQVNSAAEKPFKSFRLVRGCLRPTGGTLMHFWESHEYELPSDPKDANAAVIQLFPDILPKLLPTMAQGQYLVLEYNSTSHFINEEDPLVKKARQGIHSFVSACAQQHAPYVIHLADLAGVSSRYAGILMYVLQACKVNPNFCVVISGGLEERFCSVKDCSGMGLDSKKLKDFLEVLRLICDGRVFISWGCREVMDSGRLINFATFARNRGFNTLGTKDLFKEDLSRGMQDSAIRENTVVFPFCINYAKCVRNPDLIGIFRNDPITRALKNLNRDRKSRKGEPESLRFDYGPTCIAGRPASITPGEEEGKINPIVSNIWRSFKASLEELAARNPDDAPLFVVITGHEYYLRVYAFVEQVSQLLYETEGIDENILKRVHMIVAGGHEHQTYAIQKPMAMTASNGREVIVSGWAGEPGMFGENLCLYAVKTEDGRPARPFGGAPMFEAATTSAESIDALTYLDDYQKLLLKGILGLAPLEEYENAYVQENFPVRQAKDLALPPFVVR